MQYTPYSIHIYTFIFHTLIIFYTYAIHYYPSRTFPSRKLNKDDPNDMQWVYTKAVERGNKYNITGKAMFAIIIIMIHHNYNPS